MNSTEDSPLFCDFVCSIYDRITQIYNDIVEHENLSEKCKSCQEDEKEIPFLKNHIFAMMQGEFEPKKEEDAEEDTFMEIAETYSSPITMPKTEKLQALHGKTDFKEDMEDLMNDSLWDPDDDGPTEDYTLLAEMYLKNPEYNGTGKEVYIDMWLKPKNAKHCIDAEYEAPPKYPCPHCPEKFNNFLKIKAHCRTKHPDQPKPYIPRFQCEICGAFAQQAGALRQHMMYHTDKYPFECALCEKKLRNKQKLKEHIQTHLPKSERDKKYKCKICNKCYFTWSSLYIHRKTVHEEKTKFKCNICARNFSQNKTLQKHLLIHVNEKPRHKCNTCDLTFKDINYKRKHEKKKHADTIIVD